MFCVVEKEKLEKCVTLVEGYRAFLTYHIKATKSQLHSRIRTRSSIWMQVWGVRRGGGGGVPETHSAQKIGMHPDCAP